MQALVIMESVGGGRIINPDPDVIKREKSFRIKSEFEPSLSSLPLASPAPVKKESHEDKKSVCKLWTQETSLSVMAKA